MAAATAACCGILAFGVSLLAAPAEAQDSEPVLEMLSASWRAQEWPEITLPTRDQIRSRLGDDAYSRLALEHRGYFSGGELRRRLRGEINASLPAFQRAVDFYREAPGNRLLADRQAALTRSALGSQGVFLAGRFMSRESSPRLDVIRRVDESIHLSHDILQVARASLGALAEGAARITCLPLRAGAAERRRAVASLQRMSGLVRSRTQLTLEFAHRERDTLELAREAQAAEATLRSAFTDFSRALERVLRDADRDFLTRIDQLAADSCGAGPPA
jgi:hypothetical protein